MAARKLLLYRSVLLIVLIITLSSPLNSAAQDTLHFQKGMAFPTWDSEEYCSPDSDESLRLLAQNTCTEWVQLVPTWYQQDRYSHEIFPEYEGNTAKDECLRHAIRHAHSLGLKVMLKPHVDAQNGDWRGTFQPTDSRLWFENYRKMIKAYAELAKEEEVEILSIGCEFLELTKSEFTSAWREMIEAVREIYKGPLVYSANWWQEYLHIEFWGDLDYAGIDAYFPLTEKTDPTLDELQAAWMPFVSEMETFYETWKIPVVFTEIGYRSIDEANSMPWDWQISGTIDLKEQALCYQAVIRVFNGKPWIAGVYWWNWEPDPRRGGVLDKGYTPQGKPAEIVLKRWYCQLSKKGQKKR